jgi:hypothetical protein
MALTNIKTQEQEQEYREIQDGLKDYISDRIYRSLDHTTTIDSKEIKYNFNNSNIRYSAKLEAELISAMQQYYKIQKEEYKLTFGQTTKINYRYTFSKLV